MSVVHVAVGVLINRDEQVLIAKRSAKQHQGNKWEFPGGKVEQRETAQQALSRELKEELGIRVVATQHLTDISHTYSDPKSGDKTVLLEVYTVRDWHGEVEGKENQPILWVEKHDLEQYEFPAANVKILSLIK